MGLFQMAVETYDEMNSLVGKRESNKEMLAPIGHIISNVNIEITIDEKGQFIKASQIDTKIPIPCTEKSSSRTSGAMAHPLCDKIDYVSELDDEKHRLYLEEVGNWAESSYSTKKLDAVYKYLKNCNVLSDLEHAGLIERDENGKVSNGGKFVTWRVVGLNEESGAVYEDSDIQKSFFKYYLESKANETDVCMISGVTEPIALQHIKGISSYAGKAKLVSANDNTNFTFRGRFKTSNDAMTMGYIASQKAHNALKWLISNDGVPFGERRMVCWNPKGKSVPIFHFPIQIQDSEKKVEPSEFGEELRRAVLGYKNNFDESDFVVIASFEAATSGRLAVTYYNELRGLDFLERLYYWDKTCCWYNNMWGTRSPALSRVVNCAFGNQRGDKEKIEAEPRVYAQQMQRLIQCRIDKKAFPIDIMRSIVSKTEKLHMYSDRNRNILLFTACAVIRKYRFDNLKEEWNLALEENKLDRSYQYGRLLAILEKIEQDTYSNGENRETNAIRLQAFFVQRPMVGFNQIMTQLKTGYYPRLSINSRIFYDKLIGEIMEVISQFSEEEIGKPLSETYIMGYYLQKNMLYTKKTNENMEEE